MEKTYKASINMWELSTDAAHILHKKGSEDYPEVRRLMTRDADSYEEVAVKDIPPYTAKEYAEEVSRLIRERYSADDEFALINNVMAGVTDKRQSEYAAYTEYRDKCKVQAKINLSARKSEEIRDTKI